jgi:hypothetical protein
MFKYDQLEKEIDQQTIIVDQEEEENKKCIDQIPTPFESPPLPDTPHPEEEEIIDEETPSEYEFRFSEWLSELRSARLEDLERISFFEDIKEEHVPIALTRSCLMASLPYNGSYDFHNDKKFRLSFEFVLFLEIILFLLATFFFYHMVVYLPVYSRFDSWYNKILEKREKQRQIEAETIRKEVEERRVERQAKLDYEKYERQMAQEKAERQRKSGGFPMLHWEEVNPHSGIKEGNFDWSTSVWNMKILDEFPGLRYFMSPQEESMLGWRKLKPISHDV